MFSLFNFSSIFPGGAANPICPYVRTPMGLIILQQHDPKSSEPFLPTLAGPKAKTQPSEPDMTECRTSDKLASHTVP